MTTSTLGNTFSVNLDLNNDAFHDDATGEIARLLRQVADRMSAGQHRGRVIDHDGNVVGTFGMPTE